MHALLFSQIKLIRVLLIDEFEYMQRNLRKAFALLTISFIIFYTTPSRSLDNFRLQFTRYVYYIFYWKCIWIHLSQILILKFNSDDTVATYLPRHANFFLVYKRTRALIFTSLKDFSLWREIVFVPSSINNITIIIHYMPMSWEIWHYII